MSLCSNPNCFVDDGASSEYFCDAGGGSRGHVYVAGRDI